MLTWQIQDFYQNLNFWMFLDLNNPYTCINLEARMTFEIQCKSWAPHIIFLTKLKATFLKGNVMQSLSLLTCVAQTLLATLKALVLNIRLSKQVQVFPTLVIKWINRILWFCSLGTSRCWAVFTRLQILVYKDNFKYSPNLSPKRLPKKKIGSKETRMSGVAGKKKSLLYITAYY